MPTVANDSFPLLSYEQIKQNIASERRRFARNSAILNDSLQDTITEFWISAVSNELYSKWQNTPWDFNGTASGPRQGAIACGYFVTTLLRDMDLPINRVKLATCPSSEMMKALVPGQRLRNLSYLNYNSFNGKISELGKGVYTIGLDFHTGFIVNDGKANWFIHSNYIRRKGVTKELIIDSGALRSSKTRWLVSLTDDKYFIREWLKNK